MDAFATTSIQSGKTNEKKLKHTQTTTKQVLGRMEYYFSVVRRLKMFLVA
jgi:hypothetical protein